MAATVPESSNTFVPELQAGLVSSFSRNQQKFPVNKYAQIVPVDKEVGYYTRINREEAGRVLSTNGLENMWADSQDRPTENGDNEEFTFETYRTYRRSFGFVLGDKAVDQASFDVKAKAASVAAEKAMRMRTQQIVTLATTSGNYDTTHVSAVASIAGNAGTWEQSTTARSDIKRSLHHVAELLIKDSLNGISAEDIMLVMSPGCARKMALSQELIDYIKGSPDAMNQIRGEGKNVMFGLPDRLYGYPIVIEDSYKVTTKKGASSVTRAAILSDTTPFMCSRVGALVDERLPNSSSFSTLSLYIYEDMSVEEFYEKKHRRHEGFVTDDIGAIMTAPVSGFLFTSAVN